MKKNNLEQIDNEGKLLQSEKSNSDQEKQRLLNILDRIRAKLAQKKQRNN